MLIHRILIPRKLVDYIQKRGLEKQYKKARTKLLEGEQAAVNFKKRYPYELGIYYFRINKQYRAQGRFSEPGVLKIFKIDDHQ